MFPDPSSNQPPWLPICLQEIHNRRDRLNPWEASFIRTVAPRIKLSLSLTEKQINTLRKIRDRLAQPERPSKWAQK
jgi:hypothetical protein